MISKADLRRRIRAELAARPPAERAAASEKICAEIVTLDAWKAAESVGFFASLPTEPFIDPLFDVARAAGKRAFYPRITPAGLVMVEVEDLSELVEAWWDLREPEGGTLADHLDLVLVPGMAFTTAGGRLGRGGGYYDRLLASMPDAATVGVCFSSEVVDAIPLQAHDHPVHLVLTENGPAT